MAATYFFLLEKHRETLFHRTGDSNVPHSLYLYRAPSNSDWVSWMMLPMASDICKLPTVFAEMYISWFSLSVPFAFMPFV